jgi:hypothetical protein
MFLAAPPSIARAAYHQLWRQGARYLPLGVKDDYLPGYGWLKNFLWNFLSTPPEKRAEYIKSTLEGDTPYLRALKRAGGIHRAFHIVMLTLEERNQAKTLLDQHFATDETPSPDFDDAANVLLQLADVMLGLRGI